MIDYRLVFELCTQVLTLICTLTSKSVCAMTAQLPVYTSSHGKNDQQAHFVHANFCHGSYSLEHKQHFARLSFSSMSKGSPG